MAGFCRLVYFWGPGTSAQIYQCMRLARLPNSIPVLIKAILATVPTLGVLACVLSGSDLQLRR